MAGGTWAVVTGTLNMYAGLHVAGAMGVVAAGALFGTKCRRVLDMIDSGAPTHFDRRSFTGIGSMFLRVKLL